MIFIIYIFSHILTFPDTIYSFIDINRHYGYSVLLARNYDLYLNRNWGAIIAHLFQSAYIYGANSNVEIISSCFVLLNFLPPIIFYCCIQSLFSKSDKRLPIIATFIYYVGALGGIGWIYYVKTKFLNEFFGISLLYNNVVNTTFYQTFKTNSYGFLPSYFRPIDISMMFFFFLIMLLNKPELPKKMFFFIFSSFLVAMFLVHIVEASIFVLFLGIWGLISKSEKMRINDGLSACIIGTLTFIGIIGVINILKRKIPVYFFIYLIICIVVLIFSKYFRKFRMNKFDKADGFNFLFISNSFGNKMKSVIPKCVLFGLGIALLTWITLWDSYDISVVILNPYRQIPWFFQSIRLGLIGFVGILYFNKIIKEGRYDKSFNFFLVFSLISFLIGRCFTFINVFIVPESPFYWETRFESFIIIPWIIFAVLFLLERFDHKSNDQSKRDERDTVFQKICKKIQYKRNYMNKLYKTNWKNYSLVFLLFFSGFTTVLLNLETRWGVSAPLRSMTSQPEWEDTNSGSIFLNKFLDHEPDAAIICLSSETYGIVNLAGPGNIVLLDSENTNPIIPQSFLVEIFKAHYWRSSYVYNNVYLYLTQSDIKMIEKQKDSFLSLYLNILPIVYKNPNIYMFNASTSSFPVETSDSALLMPNDNIYENYKSSMISTAVLSQAETNFSITHENRNLNIFQNIILPYDIPPRIENRIVDYFDFINEGPWQIVNDKLITINRTIPYNKDIILSYPGFTKEFNLTFQLQWEKPENNVSFVKFSFDRDFEELSSYFQLKYTEEGDLFWNYFDEFNENFSELMLINNYLNSTDVLLNIWYNGSNFEFSINNDHYLSIASQNNFTSIGLSHVFYGNQTNISINLIQGNITGYYSDIIEDINFYKDLAFNGKNIIIFNSNGYQQFAEEFFDLSGSSIFISNISKVKFQEREYNLNFSLSCLNLSKASPELEQTAYFSNSDVNIPFIIQKDLGKGKISYINIYPYLNALNLTSDTSFEKELLKQIILSLEMKLINSDTNLEFIDEVQYFKTIDLKSPNITGDDFLFDSTYLNRVSELNISISNGTNYIMQNITQVNVKGIECGYIIGDNFRVTTYPGFYEPVFVQNQTFLINFTKSVGIVEIDTNNKFLVLNNISKISFTLNNDFPIVIINPLVETNELILNLPIEIQNFKNYYFINTNNYIKILSENPLYFKLALHNRYLALYDANFKINYPINKNFYYNELKSIPTAFLWGIIFVGVKIFVRKKKKKKDKIISL